jgi:hypothetical protein
MAMTPGGARSIADAFQKIQGFPVEVDTEQGMKNVVTKFDKRNTPASEFEVPAGYTKVENELMKNSGKEE